MVIINNIKKFITSSTWLLLAITSCQTVQKAKEELYLHSPNGQTQISPYFTASGSLGYTATFDGKTVVDSSALGFILDRSSLSKDFELIDNQKTSLDQSWEQPWGEERIIRNNYNELTLNLKHTSGILLNVIFRAFDEGIALQYEFPKQSQLDSFKVMDELTQFNMNAEDEAWWIPAYEGNRYEYIYSKSSLGDIELVHTPLTIESKNGLYLHLHEAALYDYPSMVIKGHGNGALSCDLVPISLTDQTKAYLKTPFKTPWRTIQIGQKPGDLITNYMILNLNEPNKLGDVSWVEPGKYIGVWWEMFIGVGTWHQGDKHAANTENVKKYIDFAGKHGFNGVLVEGWNYGWDGPWMNGGTKFDFTKPYPDYDIKALSEYAKAQDVYIIGHHETGADTENYDNQLDSAYAFLAKHGMKAVKTGYVENGDTLPNGYYHHGQYFVKHFQRVIETGAKYKTMIVAHEPIKDTGKRRTYPNMVSREGAKGQEYNAMGGNPVEHVMVIPFTRSLAGPFDYTPGVFDVLLKTRPDDQVHTTLCRELALYTCIYAPMQMANDLPENYEGHPAFEFIKTVPTDWERTKALNGEIGEYLTIARQKRGSEDWFLGSITNDQPRAFELSLDFLNPEQSYKATIYQDSDDTHYIDNPIGYDIQEINVTSQDKINLRLAPGGGTAISFLAVEN